MQYEVLNLGNGVGEQITSENTLVVAAPTAQRPLEDSRHSTDSLRDDVNVNVTTERAPDCRESSRTRIPFRALCQPLWFWFPGARVAAWLPVRR